MPDSGLWSSGIPERFWTAKGEAMQAFRFQEEQGARRMDFLPPEHAARTQAKPVARRADIVDVEFETVGFPSRRPSHPIFNNNRGASASRPAEKHPSDEMGVGSLLIAILAEAMAHVERLLRLASPGAFVALVAGLCAVVFLVVGFIGGSAGATPGLVISDVTTRIGDANGMKVISVYGVVENRTNELQSVPVIQIDVDTEGRRKTAARVLSGATMLAPGESRPFAARVPHVGGKLPDVQVSFSKPDASAR
ncbi:hypothetical protein QO002_003765 [Pararhizobium capsulatum DSM 1112]|uniref:DUF3426 domain-containing protein n=1 Tax=Pararhizobium capsulatum DSM 1112 TaxID=1121113 RepID=A0ABU0BTN6_9HYPH|nr:hypothetical protein [Pararhizobium capsulatum]MDQ0321627.1 hypothetical protein [Pararhizobium capsulatum DSM 1112]